MAPDEKSVERLDDRGRGTVKPPFRAKLKDGYVQVLTPDGVLFMAVRRHIRSRAPSLVSVDEEALKDV